MLPLQDIFWWTILNENLLKTFQLAKLSASHSWNTLRLQQTLPGGQTAAWMRFLLYSFKNVLLVMSTSPRNKLQLNGSFLVGPQRSLEYSAPLGTALKTIFACWWEIMFVIYLQGQHSMFKEGIPNICLSVYSSIEQVNHFTLKMVFNVSKPMHL